MNSFTIRANALEQALVAGFIKRSKFVPIFDYHYTKLLLDFMDEMSFTEDTAMKLGKCLADAVIKKNKTTQLGLEYGKDKNNGFSGE